MKYIFLILLSLTINGWAQSQETLLTILGNLQDGGSPHLGCDKSCCKQSAENKKVVALGWQHLSDGTTYLFEATPDIVSQIGYLETFPEGIFLTHAHIGHYTGLMYLGREALGAHKVSVYAMPRMKHFLEQNGPWSQLVTLNNIELIELTGGKERAIHANMSVTPITVPHRDEYSETVGYVIAGSHKKALFIPDIDKWEKWTDRIEDWIAQVDYAFLDGTFFDASEVNNRPMAEIPHPFIAESMQRFQNLPSSERAKIYFIHLNHTNPVLVKGHSSRNSLEAAGFNVAEFGAQFKL
jgi:pyrroloquinoline quinone biosynthesis protein B